MKIGLTTHNLHNEDFLEEVYSLLKNGISPDFILLHYGGRYRWFKSFNFIKKIILQYRIKSISYLLSYNKKKFTPGVKYKLSNAGIHEVEHHLASIKIINVKGINSRSTIKTIKEMGEVIIVCNSGILHSEILALPESIFLNVHSSKLPMYRGMNNIEWTLWNNHELYGTIHRISPGIDEGDILYQEKINTDNLNLKKIAEYREYGFFKSRALIGKAIRGYLDGTLKFIKQNASGSPLSQYYSMHPILKEYLDKRLAEGK
jgi:folate-dependent phosphoribosylglycinamide formyltransferase PurN